MTYEIWRMKDLIKLKPPSNEARNPRYDVAKWRNLEIGEFIGVNTHWMSLATAKKQATRSCREKGLEYVYEVKRGRSPFGDGDPDKWYLVTRLAADPRPEPVPKKKLTSKEIDKMLAEIGRSSKRRAP